MKNNLDFKVVTISPSLADKILEKNITNRPLSATTVNRYANAMLRGEWKLNGDAIRISSTGYLLDGQHRLSAIKKAAISVDCLVISGIQDDVFDTIDQGKLRSSGDILAIQGFKNYKGVAAAAKLLFTYKKTGNPFHNESSTRPSSTQILDIAEKTPDLVSAVSDATNMKWMKRYYGISKTGFMMYIFSTHAFDKSIDFFYFLDKGVNLEIGSPVYALREQIPNLDEVDRMKSSGGKVSEVYKMALAFKAFNSFCSGTTIKLLKIVRTDKTRLADLFKLS